MSRGRIGASAKDEREFLRGVGARMKSCRLRAGLTQERAAEAAGIHLYTYGIVERGQNRNPSLLLLYRLARALGVPVRRLL